MQLPFNENPNEISTRDRIIFASQTLIRLHKEGKLGGEVMPEDVHPKIDPAGADLCHYLTLGMSLNYQRNSYSLWRFATAAYDDPETRVIFTPNIVADMSHDALARLLKKHGVALQPVKHTLTWWTLCVSIRELFGGDIRNLFIETAGDMGKIITFVQKTHKKKFPYLSGPKIANYWLYVISSYTALPAVNREALSVAPDTHVIQASRRLGLISHEEEKVLHVQQLVAERWKENLNGTGIAPIDVHTPLWLWSKGGFKRIEGF